MSRKASTERHTAHSRTPSDLHSDFSKLYAGKLQSDPTRYQSASHVRHISHNDFSMPAIRRSSYQSDTTSRLFDSDARSMRVRASDVVGIRPNLRFKDNPHYRAMPDGRLPTLKGHDKSAFVDQLADELDTTQLRIAMDTDSRRRHRRQSAIEGTRRKTQVPAPARHTAPVYSRARILSEISDSHVETIQIAPISENTKTPRSLAALTADSSSLCANNLITGKSDNWHDMDLPIQAVSNLPTEPRSAEQSGIILAGNRASFPDFAILDRRDPVRESGNTGFLTTAWTSLWKRASTARTKKEIDVAQHRNKTLVDANLRHQRDILNNDASKSVLLVDDNQPSAERKKHLSASSSVLYETLDDISRPSMMQNLANAHEHGESPQNAEVPTDAFYDPASSSRTTSRATHSRNFSRPTNDSSQGFHGRNSIQQARPITSGSIPTTKLFSPLLNGDAFPRPDLRKDSAGVDIANQLQEQDIPRGEGTIAIRGFSTAAQAAGIQPMKVQPAQQESSSQTSNSSKVQVAIDNDKLATGVDLSLPLALPLAATEGTQMPHPYFLGRTSYLDTLVRRSFSRLGHDDEASQSDSICRTNSAQAFDQEITKIVMSGEATEGSKDVNSSIASKRSSSTDSLPNHNGGPRLSAVTRLEDDVDYERGIWRTGVGKPVKIVNSSVKDGPVLIDRSELGLNVPSSRRSSDTRRSMEASQMNRTSSLRGEVEQHATTAPMLLKNESYMTSVNSFHTANDYASYGSAATSRETLTESNFM